MSCSLQLTGLQTYLYLCWTLHKWVSLYKKRKLAACLQSRCKMHPVPSNTYFLAGNLEYFVSFLRLLRCFFFNEVIIYNTSWLTTHFSYKENSCISYKLNFDFLDCLFWVSVFFLDLQTYGIYLQRGCGILHCIMWHNRFLTATAVLSIIFYYKLLLLFWFHYGICFATACHRMVKDGFLKESIDQNMTYMQDFSTYFYGHNIKD